MKILITGATGLIGQKIVSHLMIKHQYSIAILSRNIDKAKKSLPFPLEFYHWDLDKQTIDENALKNVDVIIHLAGENIAEGRWTPEKKRRILESRVLGSQLLLKNIKKEKQKIRFISTSAIGFYGYGQSEVFNEESPAGDGFLAEICKAWEEETKATTINNLETIILRIGIVLSNKGGVLEKMLPVFRAGIGGHLGNGSQIMSWIHIDDLVAQFDYLIHQHKPHPVYNAVAPTPVTNKDFSSKLATTISRPSLFKVPQFALKTVFGEMSEIMLKGQHVVSKYFSEAQFKFKFDTLDKALQDLLTSKKKPVLSFDNLEWVEAPIEEVFDFFKKPHNLEKLTPSNMEMKTISIQPEKMQKNTEITHQMKLFIIPMRWKSLIVDYQDNSYFVDTQKKGPYKYWRHTHNFHPYKGGTLISDAIDYQLPISIFSTTLANYPIKKLLDNVFNYRTQELKKTF